MKRGTASRVVIGGNTMLDLPKGLVFGTDVILGGIAGLTSDFNGLVLSNTLMLGKKISHISVITVIVRGQSPLNLPYAIADSLHYVKAFGGTEQRNLPAEYTQVNYVTNTAQTMINTGVKFDFSKNYEIELKASGVTGSWYILQARESSGSPISGISGSSTGNVIGVNFDGTYVAASQISRVFGHIYYVKGAINNGNMTLYVKDETAGTEETVTGTYTPRTGQSVDICLFGNIAGNYVAINSDIYFARIKEDDNYIMDYVPCKQGTTAGFYDKVSGTFKTTNNLVAGGEAVPTPDTPMDIVSNNGVLKARHQSGLPWGYTLLESIASSGTQAINTGIKYTGNHFEVEWEAKDNDTAQSTLFACTSVSPYSGGLFGTKSDRKYYIGNGSGMIVNYSSADNAFHKWKIVVSDQTATLYKDGTQIGTASITGTIDTTHNIYLFCGGWLNANTPTLTQFANWNLKYWKLTDNGVVVFNGIPAKDANNTVGLYDTISETFKTNAGTDTFTAGSTVSDPVEIYTDGTVETINVHSRNLFDEQWNRNTGTSTAAATWGQVVTAYGWSTSGLIPVKAGQQYTVSYNTTTQIYVFYYESDGTMQQSYDTTTATKKTFTVPAGATHIRLQVNKSTEAQISELKAQLETGATATDYEPYYNGGTATCEDLLSVGSYTDVQEVIAGDVTRSVGVKVLDGTENWTVASTNVLQADVFPVSSAQPAVGGYCTALSYTDSSTLSGMPENSFRLGSVVYPRRLYVKSSVYATDATTWTNYLKAQYAAGTPVIVVYLLATPTTESVTGQTLQVQEGNNILEITQASMDDLELEASYDTGVVAIIQEVQDVNLNNNVTVTIE